MNGFAPFLTNISEMLSAIVIGCAELSMLRMIACVGEEVLSVTFTFPVSSVRTALLLSGLIVTPSGACILGDSGMVVFCIRLNSAGLPLLGATKEDKLFEWMAVSVGLSLVLRFEFMVGGLLGGWCDV